MRAILIDPVSQKVDRITIEDDDGSLLQDLREIIGCDTVTRYPLGSHVDLWLDDEGLLGPSPVLWQLEGASQPFAGRGVILGHNGHGVTVECPEYVKTAEVRGLVSFPEPGAVAVPELTWTYLPLE
mgnify:CR=1 FL=1